jgi:hypothetical protein
MPRSGLIGWVGSTQQGTVSDGKWAAYDKGDDEAIRRKAQKTVTIKKINVQSIVIKNERAAKSPNRKQEACQGKRVPHQADRIPRKD